MLNFGEGVLNRIPWEPNLVGFTPPELRIPSNVGKKHISIAGG